MASFIATVLISAAAGSLVTFVLMRRKERALRERAEERLAFEKLYGNLSYHLLAMKVLNIKRAELLRGLSSEPADTFAKKWITHAEKIANLLEEQFAFIKKEHLGLVERFMNAWRDRNAVPKIEQMFDTVGVLQVEVLKRKNRQQGLNFKDFELRQFLLSVVLASLFILVYVAFAMIFG